MEHVKVDFFGITKDSNKVYKFTITNNNGTEVDIINYGATVTSFRTKDDFGKIDDIVLGYDNISDYEKGEKFFGSTIGRNANRISNSSFKLNGKLYTLYNNEDENHLHGGKIGFHKKIWDYEVKDRGVLFTYVSEDMEEGYPGRCIVNVEFSLTDLDELCINYTGETTEDTILNLTNHSYFNLKGHSSGSILGHSLMVNGDNFTPIKQNCIPTGEIRKVDDTPFDLRKAKKISDVINEEHEQLLYGNGLDHNYCINGEDSQLKLAAILASEDKSRKLFVYTTAPGIQIYTGNYIENERGKDGIVYNNHSGICLETQYYPDSINIDGFPSPILRTGDKYTSTTIYQLK
ncbi:aldose epimerase family protein [Anaerosalibacter sp. Marseille-P3206]|uniref:aldose epimerase family protein n=1 Tax=Anaerosalibacter sp. Marseille-P3206 TaxID=1871005 RepID=UPI001356683E|nr:aldose epimerase family protein [Anaerosalibacter sp. Marseille-P3206]